MSFAESKVLPAKTLWFYISHAFILKLDKWSDIEQLFLELGADIEEREGSRVGVFLFCVIKVFHRPHPSPDTDKGAVAAIRKWLEENGVK